MVAPELLQTRRGDTRERLQALTEELRRGGADEICGDRASVYATGSGGRGEMGTHSDLDIFIVFDKKAAPPLNNLEDIRLKARLIEASEKAGFEPFTDDGVYLESYDVQTDLIAKLGTRDDDYHNVLTARLLLLLESQALLGERMYRRAIDEVLSAYWRDYPQNQNEFLPVYFANDILRFWKILCLNYEAKTGDAPPGKRRLRNYKLKYSRLLTCYSALVYLMARWATDKNTVSPEAATEMVGTSPTARLEYVAQSLPETRPIVERILASYSHFLQVCDVKKADLEAQFADSAFKRTRFDEARRFGDDVYELLTSIGRGTPLLRYFVV
jgi:hypothetical protein